jgi:hypothetical protein
MESLTRTEAKEVLTVDDYGAIRRARRDGRSIRQIARDFNHSRNTIRKVLKLCEPSPTTRNRLAPKLGPFYGIIDRILQDDETAPPKQRHTAAQVLRRLRDEHDYHGGYAQVQRYLCKRRQRNRETFIPLGNLGLIGRLKTSHLWALQNQPPLAGSCGCQFDITLFVLGLPDILLCFAKSVGGRLPPDLFGRSGSIP